MSHQQSSHEQQPETEVDAEVLETAQETETVDIADQAAIDLTTETSESAPELAEISLEDLQTKLIAAEQLAASHLEKALRVQAEMENLKKRVQKDLDDERKFGLSKFAKELLSVVDSLELGMQAASSDNPEVQKLREGSELTIKQFESVFAKFNIEAIDPTNQAFNPELHQAMVMQPSSTVEPGHVITVFQKGYVINGRLLRPAMVVVAKAE
jgi:molecular chaperone GrpE